MIKRLHRHADGVYREGPVITGFGLRVTKLDGDGRPTGEVLQTDCGATFAVDLGAPDLPDTPGCWCGDDDVDGCMNANAGYPWCRPCGEHHRPPECPVDTTGRSLGPGGVHWGDYDLGTTS